MTAEPGPRFARTLARLLPQWQEEGLVSREAAETLAERYGARGDGSRTLVAVIQLIGATLISLGVISFVSYNWDALGRWTKVAMLFGLMLACHAAGWHLWISTGKRPGLGHALILLGTGVFGASIGLLSQIFHISGDPFRAFGAWAAGALAVGMAVRSAPHALLAMGAALTAFMMWGDAYGAGTGVFPLLAALAFVPLVRGLTDPLTPWALAVFFLWTTLADMDLAGAEFRELAATAAGLGLGAWGWSQWVGAERFGDVGGRAGLLTLVVVGTLLGFKDMAEDMGRDPSTGSLWAFDMVVVSVFTTLGLVRAMGSGGCPRGPHPAWLVPVAGALTVVACYLPGGWLPVSVAATGAVVLLGGGLLRDGSRTGDRGTFWAGLVVLVMTITFRFIEHESGLLLKSAVFTGLGIAVLVLGTRFEKRLVAGGAA